jgi:rhodanese-related sulfurtransferase
LTYIILFYKITLFKQIFKGVFVKVLKSILVGSFIGATLLGANDFNLKGIGVEIVHHDDEETTRDVVIKRVHNKECKKISGLDIEAVWGGDVAKKGLNKDCTKTFLTTVGRLTPINMGNGIETFGELEVIEFIQKAQEDKSMLLIDARMSDWTEKGTIPTAVNIPFVSFDKKKRPDEFEDILEEVGVTVDDNGKYDFSGAKTLALFCNGAWCPQSTFAINNLLKIGYPSNKLKWYRGGMYSWNLAGLTTIIPE